MTEENFKYRTDPLFLRNAFDSSEPWAMPIIPKPSLNLASENDFRVIGFDKIKNGNDYHYKRAVHFFLYDYKFEDIWKRPQKYVKILKKYKAVLSPDFSMYIEMNPIMQFYNTFRNRWVGAFLASKGIQVIPTVSWGLENTFDFCFNGIEKGSVVAVSTYMVSEHGNHKDQKEFFMKGYNEMLKRIQPAYIICYHTPFPEMRGNILYVDYNLSSWQHYTDDECKTFEPFSQKSARIVKHGGYVLPYSPKGMGSAFGGEWQPNPNKPEDERFLGEPGEIKETWIYTSKGKYLVKTKIGKDGRAITERHYSDHGRPDKHTNPHDHQIDWSQNFPNPSPPINYYDNVPEIKNYGEIHMKNQTIHGFTKFESISDFKFSLIHGREIEFRWNGVDYGVFHEGVGDKSFLLCESYKKDTDAYFHSADELLDFVIQGKKLREIITNIEVLWRNL